MGSIDPKYYKLKSGKEIKIRSADKNDAASIIKINISVLSEMLYMMREPEEATYTVENTSRDIENHLNNHGSMYAVAEAEGNVIGYIEFQNGGLKRTAHAGIFSMFILKEYRQLGIGKLLLGTLINWAEQNPLIEKLTLAVFSTNKRAISLYKKCGFIEEGRCPKDMKLKDGTYIDSVLMYKFVK